MWLLTLRSLKWIRASRIEAAIIVFLLIFCWVQSNRFRIAQKQLGTAQEALKHPQVVEKVVKITVAGPTRVITKIVEKPTGEKETVTDEVHFGEMEYSGEQNESRPVGLDELIGATSVKARTDRWLLGISNRNWAPRDIGHYGLWGGYSFRNRLDLLAGAINSHKAEFHLLVVARF